MGEYLRLAAAALVGLILVLVVGRQSKDMSILLTLAVCILACLGTLEFLEPVMELLRELRQLGNLDSEAISIALKCAGVGLLSELIGLICADAGESAMASLVETAGAFGAILVSLPLMEAVWEMLQVLT